jgi:hypothetical protein
MPMMSLIPYDFAEPHVGFLPYKIWAYMLFPSDDLRRNLFLASASQALASFEVWAE